MLEGLKQANIAIGISKPYFDKRVSQITRDNTIKTGRSIANAKNVVEKVYTLRYESGVVAQVQHELAFRTSEAIEFVKNYDKYINENTVSNLVGKGNHIYTPKHISNELITKIQSVEKVPHEDTYRSDFKEATEGKHIPHDFRFTYTKYELEKKISEGVEYKQVIKEISSALNHVSAERTRYYLARA